MRIISGNAGGRKLKTPKGTHIRPTSDRVKEAIFSIISPYVPESSVLDIFAGSGSLGLECLSRGAENTVFIDISFESIKIIKENIESLGYEFKSKVIKGDYKSILKKLDKKFDIILCDPPYNRNHEIDLINRINTLNVLTKNGILVLEHSGNVAIPDNISNLYVWRKRNYGDTSISIYKKKEAAK